MIMAAIRIPLSNIIGLVVDCSPISLSSMLKKKNLMMLLTQDWYWFLVTTSNKAKLNANLKLKLMKQCIYVRLQKFIQHIKNNL